LRIKDQETRLTLQEHDDDDDIHNFICNIKSEINLRLEICVYKRVRGIFYIFHTVPSALYGCYVYLEEKRMVLDKVLV
jgi:hypothetical protein